MTETEWLTSEDPAAMLRRATQHSDMLVSIHPFVRMISDRKLRLFSAACARLVWSLLGDQRSREAIQAAERFADGEIHAETMRSLYHASLAIGHGMERQSGPADLRHAAKLASRVATLPDGEGRMAYEVTTGYKAVFAHRRAEQAAILRDVFGNPFRPARLTGWAFSAASTFAGEWSAEDVPALKASGDVACRSLTPAVLDLARAAYEHRQGDGTLDAFRLMLLADELEAAGCTDYRILDHLRDGPREIATGHGNVELFDPGPHVRGCWALDLILGKN